MDPLAAYTAPTKYRGYIVVVALHVFHAIFYEMRGPDWFHHIVFVGMGSAITVLVQPYVISTVPLLSLNGLPGAIDYLMLVCVRTGRMQRMTEK